jgi:hypothetical protein
LRPQEEVKNTINQGVPLRKATKVVRDVPGMGKAPLYIPVAAIIIGRWKG